MRPLLGVCLLLALAPAHLAAQDDASSPGGSIIAQTNPKELRSLPEIESPVPANAPSQILAEAPTPCPPWVAGIRFPRREYPRALAWWYQDDVGVEPRTESWLAREWDVACGEAHDTCYRLWRDLQFQYSCYSLCELGVAIGIAAPLANSHADQAVANWYQHHVRTSATDSFSHPGYYFGLYQYVLPVYFGVWTAGRLCDESLAGAVSADWASRSLRALAIGAPEVGVLQYVLGASRPSDAASAIHADNFSGSHWRPFNDNNGVSGHAFVGAVPFLTAASMTENYWLRGALVVGSTWSAWSRINSDSHYLSQVLLGWFIAYQSVRSVNRTQAEESCFQFSPWIDPGITGINVSFRY